MPARGAGTSSAVEERASADTVIRGVPPERAIRLGIVVWSAFRKGAVCRDGEGTPPRSADRSRASISTSEAGAHVARPAFFFAY
jgi:hypothetical protein